MGMYELEGDAIEVVEDLKPIRKRPAMYVGPAGPERLELAIGEIVGHLAYLGASEIALDLGDVFTITTAGGSYPREAWDDPRHDVVVSAFGVLHACLCHVDANGVEHQCNPVFATALSDWFEVEACMFGERRRARWERGVGVHASRRADSIDAHGLTIRFVPEAEFFGPIDDEARRLLKRAIDTRSFGDTTIVVRAPA